MPVKKKFYEVHAHRGARDLFPENTIPAFQAAWEGGADVIELDLQFTQDGAVVIHHNFEITPNAPLNDGPPFNQSPLIHSLSLADLKKLDYGLLKAPEFPHQKLRPGVRIPTLDELIDAIMTATHPQAKKVRLNIELKRDLREPHLSLSPVEIVNKALEVVRRRQFAHRVQYTSFDPEILILIRNLEPKALLGCLFSEETLSFITQQFHKPGFDFLLMFAKTHHINILCPDHTILTSTDQVKVMQEEGFQVLAWTVNDEKRWQELYQMGVNGVITDNPSEMASFVKTRLIQ
jgi:glycerophosphoryl diester phosphodiesterase